MSQVRLAVKDGVSFSTIQKIEGETLPMNEELADKICYQLGCVKKHTSDPETEPDVYSVSDQVINPDMSLRPYEIRIFWRIRNIRKNLPSEYTEGWPDGMAYSLRMVFLAAVKAGRGLAVAHHLQRAVSKAFEDLNLKDHLATILCEELGHVPDEEGTEPAYSRNTAVARAGFLTALPIEAGCRFSGMEKKDESEYAAPKDVGADKKSKRQGTA